MEKSLNLHSDLAEYVTTSSSFRQFKIKHFHLDLTVDFEKRTLRGTETLKLKCIQNSQSELLLDIRPSFNEFRLVVKPPGSSQVPDDFTAVMSNPCLTFITTCILAGDHSLADVIYPHIVKSNNAELRLRWAQIIAKNQHQPGYQHVRSFLSCQGKQMYTLPVYRALWNGSEETRALATELFTATSHQLHVNVRKYVKKIIA
uniref:Arginyl aminopeptidase (aminopeptidase B) n=1 Tax=Hucho hucho TaxID=62062 RepID=A0A4W5L0N6_9TELE